MRDHLTRSLIWIGFVVLQLSAAAHGQQVQQDHATVMAEGLELFKAHVRPLLIDQCLRCHGGRRTRGAFDLSSREALLEGSKSGAAIVPGNAAESVMLDLLRHAEEPFMPKGEDPLPADQIRHIAKWVDRGAPYDRPLIEPTEAVGAIALTILDEDRQWWSFLPIQVVSPPVVSQASWCRNPIDRFVLARIEEQQLQPNAGASRPQLIRRLYLDVIGLPPTELEIQAFVGDTSADAYSRLVDQLLASPHFGERWARHWLDVARFAESHGFEQDYDRPNAFHYRDFVTRAFNADMPYDQFVRWQLAGDEIAPENPEALMATGFLAAGSFPTQLTEKEFERARYDELDDMVGTMGTAMLGLTIGCARCHDHKYDPIPAQDYYRLLSTFSTTIRSNVDVEIDPQKTAAAHAQWDEEHQPLTLALADFERDVLPGRLNRWLASKPARDTRPTWTPITLTSLHSEGGASFEDLGDGSHLASGKSPANDRWLFKARIQSETITAFRLEALAHPSLAKGGPGRAANGNFALSDFKVFAADASGNRQRLMIRATGSTFDQKSLPASATIDEDPRSAWAVDPQFGRDHAAFFVLEEPLRDARDLALEFEFAFNNNVHHSIGRPRLSSSSLKQPSLTGASVLGAWQMVGPFTAKNSRTAFDTAFAPEAEVKLSADYEDGKLKWLERPEFKDGKTHKLEGQNSATYLYRSIESPSARTLNFAVGSDDAIKIWLNGELIHENWVQRGVQLGQDQVTATLRAGSNALLLKIVNGGGAHGFAFSDVRETSTDGLPIEIDELLGVGEQLTAAQRQVLSDWFASKDPDWQILEARMVEHLKHEPQPHMIKVMVASENVKPIPHHADGRGFPHFYEDTHFLERGDPAQKGAVATQSFLQVLMPEAEAHALWQIPPPQEASTSFRRSSLANWITDTEQGAGQLLARVIVNRLWQHLHGRGIVSTPNDFGVRGKRPTHPELLDWLADRLIAGGWRLKPILKLILESATYRQSTSGAGTLDPENLWLAQHRTRRLEAEIIRDSILSVAGLLDTTLFGPGTLDEKMKRRSLYFFQKRSKLVSPMQLFDAPQLLVSIGERSSTTIAPQALMFMNNSLVREAALSFAQRVEKSSAGDLPVAITKAYWLAFGRAPSADELRTSDAFLTQQIQSYGEASASQARHSALTDYCQALMSLNEFIYID